MGSRVRRQQIRRLLVKSLYSTRYRAFIKRMKTARVDAGLTQQALAERLRRPQSFVSKYESGDRRLDVVELIDVCSAIGIDPVDLVAGMIGASSARG